MSGRSKSDAKGAQNEVRKPVKATPSAFGKAVSLHLDGKLPEALVELNAAIEKGEESPEMLSAKAHIHFELEHYDDAVRTYEKLLLVSPKHSAANFNVAICYEKLSRWAEATEA